jgi:hypothetical protein
VLPERLVWTSMGAEDKAHVLALGNHEARVQLSGDGRLMKVKLRGGALWKITGGDPRAHRVGERQERERGVAARVRLA